MAAVIVAAVAVIAVDSLEAATGEACRAAAPHEAAFHVAASHVAASRVAASRGEVAHEAAVIEAACPVRYRLRVVRHPAEVLTAFDKVLPLVLSVSRSVIPLVVLPIPPCGPEVRLTFPLVVR